MGVGCKADSKPTSVTTNGAGSTAPAVPKRPGRPFDKASFEEIATLPFAGATTILDISDDALALKVLPEGTRPTAITVRLSRCLNCVAMDRSQWEARLADLKALLPKELRERPETVFELGDVTISGHKAIYVYQIGVNPVMDGPYTKSVMSTHAYTIYWNDGVNQAQIVAKDAAPPDSPTVEELAAKIPRDALGKLAADALTTILPFVHGT
jgi:hypothetical protein